MRSRRVIFIAALVGDVSDSRRGSTALGGIGELAVELENDPSHPHCVQAGKELVLSVSGKTKSFVMQI